jgi:hypothetical protein
MKPQILLYYLNSAIPKKNASLSHLKKLLKVIREVDFVREVLYRRIVNLRK